MPEIRGLRIHITGIVQGVGFRPFVYGLATRLALTGWVRNTSAGVDIEVDGNPVIMKEFVVALRNEAPPLAQIDQLIVDERIPDGFTNFEIISSEAIQEAFQPISPDVSICSDCLRELLDPNDRRFHYPFINCTNCGPRFTIIKDIPYDRPNTTMASFQLCPECDEEYRNPLNRRFHAQPVACPTCGPRVWVEVKDTSDENRTKVLDDHPSSAISTTQKLLSEGKIVAIKGLGGFHLACDATNLEAVTRLRNRKMRVDKPFALMMPDIGTVKDYCYTNQFECDLLSSHQRPIVILERRPSSNIALEVAPNQNSLGVMLPYTPLHYLLFIDDKPEVLEANHLFPNHFIFSALVMTSGNLAEEPIATDNDEARKRLFPLADAFLMHDRPIRTRCDDSLLRVVNYPITHDKVNRGDGDHTIYQLRRSRGYAPTPLHIHWQAPPILACGSELKNTFCLTNKEYAFVSHHIGDLENYETLRSYEDAIFKYERLFRIRPEAVAYDLHPDYLASRYGLSRARRDGLTAIGVQHHHAHIAACMAEHDIPNDEPVLGVSFDGTGFGEDSAIWGGEFLLADYRGYQRLFHLAYTPLPGGDKAVSEPWRMALSWLKHSGIEWDQRFEPVKYGISLQSKSVYPLVVIEQQLEAGINSPLTSSMGRLFDAISALCGVRQKVNYEAQAAIELEALIDPDELQRYPFEVKPEGIVDPSPAIYALISDLRKEIPVGKLSARFHNGVAEMVRNAVMTMRRISGISSVVLSGGVWQNMSLLSRTIDLLSKDDFQVFIHQKVPANDGGISLGQAAIAAHKLIKSDLSNHSPV